MWEGLSMAIKKVALIGMGAMGLLLTSVFSEHMNKEDLRIVADPNRIERYRKEPFMVNGKILDPYFVTSKEMPGAVDLAIFAVKYSGLNQAIKDMRNQIDEHTTIVSVLNGIASEQDLAAAYSPEQVLYMVAQGMDATRKEQSMYYTVKGQLAIGKVMPEQEERYLDLKAFLEEMQYPIEEPEDIRRQMWSKFMFNTGVNQVVGVYGGGYGVVQKEGDARTQMIRAMEEVLPLAKAEGILLTEDDIQYWLGVADKMGAEGKPSMLQDIEAGRLNEVELFSGTVRQLAKKHGVAVPINDWLYSILTQKNQHL